PARLRPPRQPAQVLVPGRRPVAAALVQHADPLDGTAGRTQPALVHRRRPFTMLALAPGHLRSSDHMNNSTVYDLTNQEPSGARGRPAMTSPTAERASGSATMALTRSARTFCTR